MTEETQLPLIKASFSLASLKARKRGLGTIEAIFSKLGNVPMNVTNEIIAREKLTNMLEARLIKKLRVDG